MARETPANPDILGQSSIQGIFQSEGNTEEPIIDLGDSNADHRSRRASTGWSRKLREIKRCIEQFAEGRLERTSHLDQVRVLTRSLEKVSYAFFPRASHQIEFSFAAVVCASSCPAPHSLLPTLHLPSAF